MTAVSVAAQIVQFIPGLSISRSVCSDLMVIGQQDMLWTQNSFLRQMTLLFTQQRCFQLSRPCHQQDAGTSNCYCKFISALPMPAITQERGRGSCSFCSWFPGQIALFIVHTRGMNQYRYMQAGNELQKVSKRHTKKREKGELSCNSVLFWWMRNCTCGLGPL